MDHDNTCITQLIGHVCASYPPFSCCSRMCVCVCVCVCLDIIILFWSLCFFENNHHYFFTWQTIWLWFITHVKTHMARILRKKKDKAFWTKRTERIKNKNFGGINYSLEHIIIIIIVFRYYATCGTWPLLTKEFIHSKGTCLAHEQRETENKKTQTHPCMEKEYDSVW